MYIGICLDNSLGALDDVLRDSRARALRKHAISGVYISLKMYIYFEVYICIKLDHHLHDVLRYSCARALRKHAISGMCIFQIYVCMKLHNHLDDVL